MDDKYLGLMAAQSIAAAQSEALGFVGRQHDPNQDYLDRVALEAMKKIIPMVTWDDNNKAEQLAFIAESSHELARAMLAARSQGGAV